MTSKPGREAGNDAAAEIAPDFEQSLAELEALIGRLERGDLPLAESLDLFEQGVALTRQCHARLSGARQRVEILLKDGARPFDPGSTDGDE
ncbi:MAG TPA: exodeoxyribonuclease VII small subunit [Steroidobacteraceae bacterium]|nr:exodeoxyribonuclease VII small subunit [Steroidobacteraceae bacterium]